jgi:malonyl CoA-acyl carrier protein transacylase
MARLGVTRELEIGPGRVLTGLVRRIEPALARGNRREVEELPDAARDAAAAGA